MEKIILNGVLRSDNDETELELTVQGRRVTALFPAAPKNDVYRSIKSILTVACIENNFNESMQKI